jgi:hypothetical protein
MFVSIISGRSALELSGILLSGRIFPTAWIEAVIPRARELPDIAEINFLLLKFF